MAFVEAEVGPVTDSPTIADTSAAEASVAQSVEPPAGGTGEAEPVTGAESEGRVVLEFESHADRARTSTDMETSIDLRTIGLFMPNRARFERSNYRRSSITATGSLAALVSVTRWPSIVRGMDWHSMNQAR
jgi:hypothetical protein